MIITGHGFNEQRGKTDVAQGLVVTEEGVHNLGVFVSAAHPINGNMYFASCVKEKAGIKQHLVIHRLKMGSTTFEEVHRFLGGGGPGAYAKGQITPGNCELRPDGTLICSFSACPVGSQDDEWKSCCEPLYAMDVAWQYLGPAVQVPSPVILPGTVDETARTLANQAKDQARLANTQGSQNATAIGNLQKQVAAIPLPLSASSIADIAWQKAIDSTARPEFITIVKHIAQQALVDAITFARTASATTSRLRGLIELIIGEKKP